MPRPTAADLITRLREVHEEQAGMSLSDEKLAGRLPITLSTLNRWKKGDTRQFAEIVAMLDEAGWLTASTEAGGVARDDQEPSRSPLEELQVGISRLLLGQAEALARLDQVRDEVLARERPEQKPAVRKRSSTSQRAR